MEDESKKKKITTTYCVFVVCLKVNYMTNKHEE